MTCNRYKCYYYLKYKISALQSVAILGLQRTDVLQKTMLCVVKSNNQKPSEGKSDLIIGTDKESVLKTFLNISNGFKVSHLYCETM